MVLRRSKRLRGPIRIDHALLPHIAELILAHAPWSALLAFRATSHYFCDYITPLLVHHLALYPLSEDDHDHLLVRSPYGGHIPGFEGIDLTSDEKDQDNIKSFTQHTRVLDLEGYIHPQHLGRLVQMFPNLETYRITTDPMTGAFSPFFIPCKTLVLFTSDIGMNPLNPIPAQLAYHTASLQKIPDGVTKVVINMRGGNWYTPANYTLPATVKEVTVIFPSYELGSQVGSFVNKVDRNKLAASTATFLEWSDAWYTLVGLDEIKLLVRSFLAISDTEFRKKYKLAAFLTRDLYAIATGVQNISLESVERFYQGPVIPFLGQNDGDHEFAHLLRAHNNTDGDLPAPPSQDAYTLLDIWGSDDEGEVGSEVEGDVSDSDAT
ncbi:uncharacterized protein EHS24_006340 [Apiotrichum porosum]|uniref:Uncharacterized protein n=1 Tax=Apiotrichum porosum TaxID=105984 RepID=A0A427Y196_9TREE|nr:uncharacterized protein EHS24_006340 [Apiotrichum porosum]RSH84813.1 hypothetical protein EHS24_006340 [Apiotrichum porosum]